MAPVGNVNNVNGLASILGRRVSSLPMNDLSLPLGVLFKAKSIWDGIIEKKKCRLAGWKKRHLSKGGRVTLTKSTLYIMTNLFFISKKVLFKKRKAALSTQKVYTGTAKAAHKKKKRTQQTLKNQKPSISIPHYRT
jgi:hypothetical protein